MLITILIFVLLISFNVRASYYEGKWFILALISIVALSLSVYSVSNFFFALFFGYILISAAYNGLHAQTKGSYLFIQFECMRTTISIFAIGIIFCAIGPKTIEYVKLSLPYLLMANLAIKAVPEKYRAIMAPNGQKVPMCGFGGNTSVDSSLSSLMFAIMLTEPNLNWIHFVATLSFFGILICNKGMAGALAGAVSIVVYLGFNLGSLDMAVMFASACGILCLHKPIRAQLLTDSGRLNAWRFAWKFLVKPMNKWFGLGSGVFRYMMPMAEKIHINEKNYAQKESQFIWMHNDIYQAFIELGAMGMIICVMFLASILPMFGANEWIIFSCVCVNMAVNFPMHMAPDAFLIVMCLKEFFLKNL